MCRGWSKRKGLARAALADRDGPVEHGIETVNSNDSLFTCLGFTCLGFTEDGG